MWKIKKIRVKNLGSIVDETFVIEDEESFVIMGDNRDEPDQKSNGSGKSWVLEAFSLLLIGTSLKPIPISDIIRDFTDSMEIYGELENKFLNQKMSIERKFHRKKSSLTKVIINDEDQKDKFVQKQSSEFVLKKIGISKEDLLYYYIISRKRFRDFFSSSDTAKKEIISRFSGADIINGIDTIIEKEISKLELRKTSFNNEIISANAKIEVLKEDIEIEKNLDFEKERSDQLKKLEASIVENRLLISEAELKNISLGKKFKEDCKVEEGIVSEIKENDSSLEIILSEKEVYLESSRKKIVDFSNNKNEIRKKIDKIDEINVVKFQNISNRRSEINSNKLEFKTFLAELETKITGVVECPSCEHKFSLTEEGFDVESTRDEVIPECIHSISEFETSLSSIDSEKTALENKIEEDKLSFNDKIKSIDKLIIAENQLKDSKLKEFNSIQLEVENLSRDLSTKLREIRSSLKLTENQDALILRNIIQYKSSIELAESTISIKNKEVFESKLPKLNKKVEDQELIIKKVELEVVKLEDQIFKKTQWIYNFKKFNTFLANKAIGTIESLTNKNLKDGKSSLRIKLDGFKVLGNKEIRENISTTIFRNGINKGRIEKLSEGEKSKVVASNIIALQEIINNASPTGGLDFLGIDEILDSLDELGISLVAGMINDLKKTSLLISHIGTAVIPYENVWVMRLENSESRIIL